MFDSHCTLKTYIINNPDVVNEAAAAVITERNAKISRLQDENSSLKRQIKSDRQNYRNLQRQHKECRNDLLRANKMITSLSGSAERNKKLCTENSDLKSKNAALQLSHHACHDAILNLKIRLEKLTQENQEKDEDIKRLEQENRTLKDEIEQLKTEVKRRTGENSTNSNYPSSHDYGSHTPSSQPSPQEAETAQSERTHEPAVKDVEEPARRVPTSSRVRSGKKRGGQCGHPDTRKKLQNEADEIVDMKVKKAPTGAEAIYDADGKLMYYRLQTQDVKVTSHLIEYRFTISKEGQDLPEDVMSRAKISPFLYTQNFKTYCVYLYSFCGIPFNRLTEMLREVTGRKIRVSESAIVNWMDELANKSTLFQNQLLDELMKEPVLYVDETGVRIARTQYWAHTIVSRDKVYFTITKSRGDKVDGPVGILRSRGYKGILMHDHFASYLTLIAVTHAECLVHLERYLRNGVEYDHSKVCARLLDVLHRALARRYELIEQGEERMPAEELEQLRKEIQELCRQGIEKWNKAVAECPGKEKYKPPYVPTLVRVLKDTDHYLRCMEDFRVDYGNNRAEQQVQAVKIHQKVSRQFVTKKGADSFARVLTIQQNCKMNGLSILETFSQILNSTDTTPSLFNE